MDSSDRPPVKSRFNTPFLKAQLARMTPEALQAGQRMLAEAGWKQNCPFYGPVPPTEEEPDPAPESQRPFR
ncbi:MAG: hypothetical protein WC551_00485 [Patescibacteria group bacterium]